MEKGKVSGLEKVLKVSEKLKKKWQLCDQQEIKVDYFKWAKLEVGGED